MTQQSLFTEEQRALLKAVLNRIIPAEHDRPGAGDLGVTDAIERGMAPSPSRRRAFLEGLGQIDLTSWREADRAFPDLSPERQDHVLTLVERAHPSFFEKLVSHTYRAYYANPKILPLVGAESRPPQPVGYSLPPFDPSLLENVRRRGAIYRKA